MLPICPFEHMVDDLQEYKLSPDEPPVRTPLFVPVSAHCW